MKPILMYEHSIQHFAPGVPEDTRDPAQFCRKTLKFGTQGEFLRTEGFYRPEVLAQPVMLTNKPKNYYLDLYRDFRAVEKQHYNRRLPVYIAKGTAWGTVALGAVLCSTGLHAHIGAGLVLKGLAAGAAVGTLAGVEHEKASMRGYRNARLLMYALHQMHETYLGERKPAWMDDQAVMFEKRKLMSIPFTLAYQELKAAGVSMASPFLVAR